MHLVYLAIKFRWGYKNMVFHISNTEIWSAEFSAYGLALVIFKSFHKLELVMLGLKEMTNA